MVCRSRSLLDVFCFSSRKPDSHWALLIKVRNTFRVGLGLWLGLVLIIPNLSMIPNLSRVSVHSIEVMGFLLCAWLFPKCLSVGVLEIPGGPRGFF